MKKVLSRFLGWLSVWCETLAVLLDEEIMAQITEAEIERHSLDG